MRPQKINVPESFLILCHKELYFCPKGGDIGVTETRQQIQFLKHKIDLFEAQKWFIRGSFKSL